MRMAEMPKMTDEDREKIYKIIDKWRVGRLPPVTLVSDLRTAGFPIVTWDALIDWALDGA
jgi:hypothetical protein